jgi:hypothetical protein
VGCFPENGDDLVYFGTGSMYLNGHPSMATQKQGEVYSKTKINLGKSKQNPYLALLLSCLYIALLICQELYVHSLLDEMLSLSSIRTASRRRRRSASSTCEQYKDTTRRIVFNIYFYFKTSRNVEPTSRESLNPASSSDGLDSSERIRRCVSW